MFKLKFLMKRISILTGLLILSVVYAQPKPLDKGPADESAYWILKFPGALRPVATVYSNKINFSAVEVGKEVESKLKILNKGYGNLKIKRIYLKEGKNFAIKSTTCTKPLEFGHSCDITVLFKPTSPGEFKDVLHIETNDPNRPIITVELSGEAKGAVIEKTPEIPKLMPIPQIPKSEEKPIKKVKRPKHPISHKSLVPKIKIWVVKPCDTLWDISSNVYGTPLLWAAIYEANKDKIMDPWMLTVGWKLKIPVLTPKEAEKYRKETVRLMEEMADRPLGPKCP